MTKAARGTTSADAKERILAVVARALGHASADVQASALSVLENRTALVDRYRPVMAASVRARLETTTPETAVAEAPPPVAEAQRVVPVDNLGELAELFAAVLENQGPPVDIERVIDGVARIGATERITASLAVRAGKLLERRDRRQPGTALADLALAWTNGRRIPEPATEEKPRWTSSSGACGVLPEQVAQRKERASW